MKNSKKEYKEWLRRELQEGATSQGAEDVALAEEGMKDYLKIIDRDDKKQI